MDQSQTKIATPSLPVKKGLYDEFTVLTPLSYARVALIEGLIETLGDEFWNFVLELDAERQGMLLENLKNNQELAVLLVKNGKENILANIPQKFELELRDGFLAGAKELPIFDPRRLAIAKKYKDWMFLDTGEIKNLALRTGDEEIETVIVGLNAKQILVFAKALPIAKLLDLPNIVKRATVLAQVKSVICAETEADPKLRQICITGKWATIRTFGVKKTP